MHLPIRSLSIGLVSFMALATAVVSGEAALTSGPILYGVTGEGGTNSETLFRIDHETASTRRLTKLGNGGDGEEIAYNPRNGRLLHASGRFLGEDKILEWINPSTLAVTAVPVSGDECDEVTALTYFSGGTFLAGTVDKLLCSITDDGAVAQIAVLGSADIATGLAWVNGKLYATEWGNKTDLLTLDRKTGEVISRRSLKVGGKDYRITALAAHPCTDELYAVMEIGKTEIRTPSERSLVTINPSNGGVEVVGDLDANFAGLAFVSESCAAEQARPNANGAIEAILLKAAQANREPAAIAPAAQPTPVSVAAPAVRPPNAGTAGLLDNRSRIP